MTQIASLIIVVALAIAFTVGVLVGYCALVISVDRPRKTQLCEHGNEPEWCPECN